MNILVTGGAGYIGSMLVDKLLKDGHQVTVVDSLLHGQGIFVHHILSKKNCTFYFDDVQNIPSKEINKADVVYWLAALVGAPLCEKVPEEAVRVNTTAVQDIVDRLSPNQRIIFPNTNSGYGSTGEEACTEETPLNSISIYGKTKEEAERAVMIHPLATSFRLATLHGVSYRPRVDLLVNYFTYLAKFCNHIDMFEGNFRRNFVHISDVVDIFIKAMYMESTFGEIYNLGRNEDNMTKTDLVDTLKQFFPTLTTRFIDKADPDQRDYLVDNSKLYKLGLIPQISVARSIKELKEYFQICSNLHPHDKSQTIKLLKNV